MSVRMTVGCVRICGCKNEEVVYEMCGMWDVWGVRLSVGCEGWEIAQD